MIKISNLSVNQGQFSINDINLEISNGEYCVLMGQSGCGKTTLMEAICGLRQQSSGKIVIDGKDITSIAPALRKIGYVPQDGALFPTMTAKDQISFPLILQKKPQNEITETIDKLAKQLNIAPILDRLPENLSGGEKQRIALARALAVNPLVMCFDEPLSALDEELHTEMCELLKKTVKERHLPCLHITHNRKEALAIADTVYKFTDRGIKKLDLK